MGLTPKQEKFCQGVVSGMSYKDAYIAAYDTNSEQAAYVESSKLALRDDIQNKIAALQKPIEQAIKKQVISDRERKRAFLWSVIDNPEVSYADRLRATDILNKMDAEYINITQDITQDSTIQDISTEQLKLLAGTG